MFKYLRIQNENWKKNLPYINKPYSMIRNPILPILNTLEINRQML